MSKPFRLPWWLVALDGLGIAILVLGLLGMLEVDIGLPVLDRIWQFLVVLGLALMAPLIVSVVQATRK
ncbi:MAG: hypothetical protein PVJ33_05815 [Lysobacterales bacterium]|jgi:hypothetical protein